MARTNKNTRARSLPPRLQLRERDEATGSYPAKIRIASDNRTGKYNARFDDTRTMVFETTEILYPSMLPSGSVFVEDELVTTLSASGKVRIGISDTFIAHTSVQQTLESFRDNDNPAADGLSNGNVFYATGSNPSLFGSAFQQPLWSKTKIEISTNIAVETSIQMVTGTAGGGGESYDMAYYNFDSQRWEGIGRGAKIEDYTNAGVALQFATIGFCPSLLLGQGQGEQISAGAVCRNFGFPHHPKFHATSSQTFSMEDKISSPFLVEKIVMEVSATYDSGNDIAGTDFPLAANAAINTMFILVQQEGANFTSIGQTWNLAGTPVLTELDSSIPQTINLTVGGGNTLVNTTRSILTFAQATSFTINGKAGVIEYPEFGITDSLDRDVNIFPNTSTKAMGLNWTQKVKFEVPARSPAKTPGSLAYQALKLLDGPKTGKTPVHVLLDNNVGGRDGLLLMASNGRSLRSEFTAVPPVRQVFGNLTSDVAPFGSPPDDVVLFTPSSPLHVDNPFILHPKDKLVVGWQIPLPKNYEIIYAGTNGSGSMITFHPGEYKIVLYGSQMQNGRETHDTLNQLLVSNVAYEVIE